MSLKLNAKQQNQTTNAYLTKCFLFTSLCEYRSIHEGQYTPQNQVFSTNFQLYHKPVAEECYVLSYS